jgi:hypothetical protein
MNRLYYPNVPPSRTEGFITRRKTLCGLGAVGAYAVLGGCGGTNGSQISPLVANPQPVPAGAITPASIFVSNTVAGTIGPNFAGLSYDKVSMALPRFTAGNADLIGLFRTLGPNLLRIGGSSVDSMHWAPNGAGLTSGQIAPPDIDSLAQFLEATDWTLLYSVNLATSTPADAAAEAAYAAQSVGSRLYGIELGNEPNVYAAEHLVSNWNLQIFEQTWEQFRNAVVQTIPAVRMTGPADVEDITSWTIPFAQQFGTQIHLLTQHYYRGNGLSPSSTASNLISPDPQLVGVLALLKSTAAAIGIPFRLSETNSYFDGGAPGVSDSYASALWVIDFLFTVALGGGSGVNMTGGGDTPGYTPIADNIGSVVEARPEYYGILLFNLAGEGALLAANVSSSTPDVTVYAVSCTDGSLSILIVNKDLTQNLQSSIDCGRAVNSARLMLMTGPSLSATTGVTIQGASVAQDGKFAPSAPFTLPMAGSVVSCYVPALSAALIRVT